MAETPPLETKQEMISRAKELAAPDGGFSLRPRTFDEAYRFANLIAESDLIPPEFKHKPANVLVAVQLGMELGVSPMQALQNIYVINGRPSIFGDLLPAIVFQSGFLESIKEEGDDKTATCTVKRNGHEAISRTFTMEQAERAKLPERNPTYKAYPKRMLQMRARSWAFRDMFPDVLKGVGIREELEDENIIETTARREPLQKPKAIEAATTEASKPGGQNVETNIESAPTSSGGGSGSETVSQAPPAAEQTVPTDKRAKRAKVTEESSTPFAELDTDKQVQALIDWITAASDDEIM